MPLLAMMLLLGLLPVFSASAASTYYVRVDGGDRTQCTGKKDAAYPGSGSSQACAWGSPMYALPPDDKPHIAGGDTLIIGPGSYKIGYGAPGSNTGRCGTSWRYDCYMAVVPSGPSASSKTRILGKGYDGGCPAPPSLWGSERVDQIFSLKGSSNVEIGCLEITDHSDCVEFHSDNAARCQRDTTPYGDWAPLGIWASASHDVWLHDLNIHGMANRGLMAGGIADWTVERVKLVANGWAGWDGDIGAGSSNSGLITLREVQVSWNGCGEQWKTGMVWACWAQTGSGYGDGLGTAKTGGDWLIEDSYFDHNTSDGLDLLYADGTGTITVRRTYAGGNAGNQIKTNGAVVIENSVVVGNCAYFNGKYDMQDADQCRALGNAVSVGLVAGKNATLRHNTITGQGDCLIITSGGSSASRVYIQNNALVGQLDWRSNQQGNIGELTCGHYADNSTAAVAFSGNLFWSVKQGQCPSGSVCNKNPMLGNMTLDSFDPDPLTGSPLIDRAPDIGVEDDFYGQARPFGPAPDIGAVEVGGLVIKTGGILPPTQVTQGTTAGLQAGAVAVGSHVDVASAAACGTECGKQPASSGVSQFRAAAWYVRFGRALGSLLHLPDAGGAVQDGFVPASNRAERTTASNQLVPALRSPAAGLARQTSRAVVLPESATMGGTPALRSIPAFADAAATGGGASNPRVSAGRVTSPCITDCAPGAAQEQSLLARLGALLESILVTLGLA